MQVYRIESIRIKKMCKEGKPIEKASLRKGDTEIKEE